MSYAPGTWKIARTRRKLTLASTPFETLTERDRGDLEEGERLVHFMAEPDGVEALEVRFEARSENSLLRFIDQTMPQPHRVGSRAEQGGDHGFQRGEGSDLYARRSLSCSTLITPVVHQPARTAANNRGSTERQIGCFAGVFARGRTAATVGFRLFTAEVRGSNPLGDGAWGSNRAATRVNLVHPLRLRHLVTVGRGVYYAPAHGLCAGSRPPPTGRPAPSAGPPRRC
jgi:hypothetical protein